MEEKENVFAGNHDGSVFETGNGTGLSPSDFDGLLEWATRHKSSDIIIQPGIPVKAKIGGALVSITKFPISHPEVDLLVRHIYSENGPAEILGGNDLDPSYEIRVPGELPFRFRVNMTGGRSSGESYTGQGTQIVIRSLPRQPVPIEKLNIEDDIIKSIRPEQGIILICGPTGSGKSTLLSSMIRKIVEDPDSNAAVIEYSAPVEYVYDGIVMPSSTVFQTHAGVELRPRNYERGNEKFIYEYCTRNSLRRHPDIIVIGEARDRATISGVVEAGLTGHLVYSTLHTIGVGETLRRLISPFESNERNSMAVDIMESLRMIVTQRLVKKIGGGLVACREYMIFGGEVRDEFLKTDYNTWPKLARRLLAEERAVGRTMAAAALELLGNGLITEKTYETLSAKKKYV